MTPAPESAGSGPGAAILSRGFRPFFLSAALWAACSMVLWLLMLRAGLALPSRFDLVAWHAHEALFGYLGAVLAGFLLTAVPNWTGRPPLAGWPLLGLVMLWLFGRAAVAVSAYLPPWTVAVADLAGLVVLGGIMAREIVAAGNWRNLIIVAMIGVFVAGNALFHAEAARSGHPASGYGLRTGLAAAIMMISLVGGRIVPTFTRNWLTARGGGPLPAEFGRPDQFALVLSLLALACWTVFPRGNVTGILLFGAGVAQVVRLARWRGWDTGSEALIWILHAGYAFVPIGMLAIGIAIVWPGSLSHAAAQHLWMAGAIGVMTLAVMTRAVLGHTGRPLSASPGTTAIFLLVVAAAVVRPLSGNLPQWAPSLWTVSTILWTGGFAGFALLYGRMMIGPDAR